ncbi:von Willebrand factor type A domain-containing protein [Mucilaginibacter sp. AW1-3]
MKNLLILLLALFSLSALRPDKTRTISGTVYDNSTKKALPGVQVQVMGTSVNAGTDQYGHYTITIPGDKSQLSFNLNGYEKTTLAIGKTNMLNVYLKKVVLKADTFDYKASAYTVKEKNLNEVTLLSKMPGVNVDAKGNITAQGKQIAKTKLNSKDYYGGNVQQAVRNLPANITKDIQIIDDYGDQASRTGIKSGAPNKILNMQLRGRAGNESYDKIIENKFENPLSTPLSTFAVDVDAASYANVRRYINGGQLPPKNAVRIEEMINYFHYDLAAPTNGAPVAIHTELSTAPWNPQHQLVRIGLKAKEVKTDKLPPSNLVFLIDVSGSMDEPNKLPLVKTSMKMLVDNLRPIDHVAIVVYASEVGVKLESTPGNEKEKIKDAIDQLGAGGSTAGGAGIMMAYKIASQKFIKGGNNRIILATDGDFNVGPSSNKDMEQLIEEERESKVSISILGFGMGNLKDSKMERMADKGHGNYAYIDNIQEATKSMVHEFGGTLFTVAKDVKVQVEFNPAKVQAYRLLGYEDRLLNKEDFNNDTKLGGDMGVGHTVTALYEIIPAGVKDSFAGSVDPLKYQKPAEPPVHNNSADVMTVKFRYKQPDGDVSKMESVVVADKPLNASKTSDDFRFAAAVAEYGLLLRDSQFKQNSKFDQLIAMAKGAKGKDDDGYRAEFIRLVESTKGMMKGTVLAVRQE